MKTEINGYDVTHVFSATGEVICTTSGHTEIIDGELTESDLKKKEYIDTHVLNFNEKEGFVKMFTETAYVLALNLPPKEYQVAMGLSKFVFFESCALKNGYGKSSHFMDLKEIADVMHMDYSRASRVMKSLIDKGVIGQLRLGEVKTGESSKYYIANPYIYINGKNPEKSAYDYFARTGWKELLSNTQN